MNVYTNITIEHGGTSLEMTLEEAKDLLVSLSDITNRSSLMSSMVAAHAELIAEHERLKKELTVLREAKVTND